RQSGAAYARPVDGARTGAAGHPRCAQRHRRRDRHRFHQRPPPRFRQCQGAATDPQSRRHRRQLCHAAQTAEKRMDPRTRPSPLGRKMVSKTLELIFDFGSPNAYLTLKTLPELLDRTGADLIITPCLLGGIFKATGNKAPMIQYAEAPAKLAYEHLEMRRFIAKHGLSKFRLNPHFPVNTLTIMRGAIVADDEGNLDDYVD